MTFNPFSLAGRTPASRYASAFVITIVAAVLQMSLSPVLGGARYLILIGAIVISAIIGGFGPALLSIVLSAFIAAWFFIAPIHALFGMQRNDAIQLAAFTAFMMILAWVISASRLENTRLRAELVRQYEESARSVDAERQRLADLIESVPGVVWEAWGEPDTRSQRIDFVSDHVERMLGYTTAEWLAEPNFWLTLVHPDDREAAAKNAHEHFLRGGYATNAFRWLTKDGRELWVESHSTVVTDEAGRAIGMRGVVLDVSARRRAEESLRFLARVSELVTSTLDLQGTLDNAAEAALPLLGELCMIDLIEDRHIRRAAVRHVNPALAGAAEALREHPPDPEWTFGAPQAIRTGKPDVQQQLPEGLVRRGETNDEYGSLVRQFGTRSFIATPLIARGQIIGAVTVASATPSRYDAADVELAMLFARRIALAIDNAQLHQASIEANRAKDDFLATVSHELRTPMTATLGWVRMLQMGTLDETTEVVALDAIERSTRAQAKLIEDILDVAGIISGKFHLEVAPVDLRVVVSNAIETLHPAAAAKQIAVSTSFDGVHAVQGDAARLQQIVWNLLANAIKFGNRGGHIDVKVSRHDGTARIEVTDDGPGIEADFLPHVFDRFRQADSGATRTHGGLGLGLAIVRHLSELHGGTVSAASPGRGQGATFTVELPLVAG